MKISFFTHFYVRRAEKNHNNIVKYQIDDNLSEEVIDSSSRHGYCVFKANSLEEILSFMPKEEEK